LTRAKRRRKEGRFLRALGIFLLINILPLGGAVWFLWRYLQGDLPDIQLPSGWPFNLSVLGGGLLALVLVASLSLPAAHRAVQGTSRRLGYLKAVLGGRAEGSRLIALLLLPPIWLAWVLVWIVRSLLLLGALALIALSVLFMIRLFNPDFCQAWIDKAIHLGAQGG